MTFSLTFFFYLNYQELTEQLFTDILDCSHLFHVAITTSNSNTVHIQVISASSTSLGEAFKTKVFSFFLAF